MRYFAISLALLLVGCGPTTPAANEGQTAKRYSAGPVFVYEIVLDDGTQCAVATYNGTGIDCNWGRDSGE